MRQTTGYQIGPFTLPAFGLGVYGLVYGVLIGSAMFFLIQIPGLIMFKFKWAPKINLRDPDVRKILVMLGPRVASMFLYQLTFIARDNLASRLPLGSVTALTYGWMILQVPETLIGTAIGTALLPTISEMVAKNQRAEFSETINRVIRVFIALTIPSASCFPCALRLCWGLPLVSIRQVPPCWYGSRAHFWSGCFRTACWNWAPGYSLRDRMQPFHSWPPCSTWLFILVSGCCCSDRSKPLGSPWQMPSLSRPNPPSCSAFSRSNPCEPKQNWPSHQLKLKLGRTGGK